MPLPIGKSCKGVYATSWQEFTINRTINKVQHAFVQSRDMLQWQKPKNKAENHNITDFGANV